MDYLAHAWFKASPSKRDKIPVVPTGNNTRTLQDYLDEYSTDELAYQQWYVEMRLNLFNYPWAIKRFTPVSGEPYMTAFDPDFQQQFGEWYEWFSGQGFDENASITLQCEPYYVNSGGNSYDYGGTHYHFMKAYENDPSKGVFVNFPMTVTLKITNSNVIPNLDKFDVFIYVQPGSRNVSRIVLALKNSYEVVLNESGNNVGKVNSIKATESTTIMSWTYSRATFTLTSYNTITIDYNGNFTAYTKNAGETIWQAGAGGFCGWSQSVEVPMPPVVDVNPKPTPETDEPVPSPDIDVPDPGEPGQPTVPSLPDLTGDLVTQTDVDLQPVIDAISVLNGNVIKILQQLRRVGQNVTSAVYDVYGRIDYWGTHFDTMLATEWTGLRGELYSYYSSIFGAIQTFQTNVLAYLAWIERDLAMANQWLSAIFAKVGGGLGSMPDMASDRDGFWGAVASIGEGIVTDLLGAGEQMAGLATEATRLKDVFPFSALFLVPTLMAAFDTPPVAPNFTWTLILPGGQSYAMNVNLTQYNDIAAVVRTCVLAAYVVVLAWETPDMAERMRGLLG